MTPDASHPPASSVHPRPDRTSPAGLSAYIDGTTLLSSEDLPWQDVFVQVFARRPVQPPVLVPAVIEPLVVWVMEGRAVIEEREPGGAWVSTAVEADDLFVTRSPTPYEMRWRVDDGQPMQVMHVYLGASLFERVAQAVAGQAGGVRLRDVAGARDPQLLGLLSLLHAELTAPQDGTALYVAGLAQSLAVHLLRHYAEAGGGRACKALPDAKLRRAIAHLDAHLDAPFDLHRLAATVDMSAFHFSRLFKQATGFSPSRYFIHRRIAEARRLLQETGASIVEIGLAVGYASPSHFAQVFRRETGLSPRDYRRS